jgi:superfamily II DNA/RNA helicase
VTHVIQAQFAPNAIDFIHRVGRTGRVGSKGKVTSLYQSHDLALMQVLKQYIEEGRPLEAAFSRARSFSRKLKRKGEFVARGYRSKTEYEKDLLESNPDS